MVSIRKSSSETVEIIRVEIAKMELNKGDILVIKTPYPLWPEQQEYLRTIFPDGVNVLYFSPETEISLIREGTPA